MLITDISVLIPMLLDQYHQTRLFGAHSFYKDSCKLYDIIRLQSEVCVCVCVRLVACWPVNWPALAHVCVPAVADPVPAPSSRTDRCSVICVKGDPPLNGIVSVTP